MSPSEQGVFTVVYVEDDPDIREVVETALSLDPALRLSVCESGAQALECLSRVRPDLVVLDVMMPGLDGPATVARMRADPLLQDIPVVFMTAKALPQELASFRALGAVGVIAKPFDPMKLAAELRKYLGGAK